MIHRYHHFNGWLLLAPPLRGFIPLHAPSFILPILWMLILSIGVSCSTLSSSLHRLFLVVVVVVVVGMNEILTMKLFQSESIGIERRGILRLQSAPQIKKRRQWLLICCGITFKLLVGFVSADRYLMEGLINRFNGFSQRVSIKAIPNKSVAAAHAAITATFSQGNRRPGSDGNPGKKAAKPLPTRHPPWSIPVEGWAVGVITASQGEEPASVWDGGK